MKKIIALALAAVMVVSLFCGCSAILDALAGNPGKALLMTNDVDQSEADLVGSWVDTEDDYIIFKEDGTVEYFGEDYDSYTFDGKTLALQYGDEEFVLGARLFGTDFVLFKEAYTYDRVSGTEGELAGEWASNDDYDYSFSFADGKFVEDGEYTGRYEVDGEEIVLIYDDDNTYCYGLYNIKNDELSFYYGWPLVPSED